MFTLKQLEAFYWASTSPSFNVAAERLHISASSLSKRLAELEEELGRPLFDRSGHRAVPTLAGRQLLPLSQRILGLTDEAMTLLADDQAIRGQCKFGIGELAAVTWLPDLMSYVRERHPNLRLEPYVDLGTEITQRVDDGELDFAIIAGTYSRPAVITEAVANVQFTWAASRSLVAGGREITSALLESTALISMPLGMVSTNVLERWLSMRDLPIGRRLFSNNINSIAALLAAGAGIGALPTGWVERLAVRDVVVHLQSEPNPTMEYTFQTRRDDTRPLITAMRQAVKATVDFTKPNPLW